MLERLEHWDWAVSMAINGWHAPWADKFMHAVSVTSTWIAFYLVLLMIVYSRYRKNIWVLVLGLIVLVGLADFTSVHFFKNVFMRLRPCCEPRLFELYTVHGYAHPKQAVQYGFISSHAANCFAIAAYVSLCLKGVTLREPLWGRGRNNLSESEALLRGPGRPRVFAFGFMYVWAALIGYSRVYLAKHYVGDVVCGALWGVLTALFVWWLTRLALARVCPSAYPAPWPLWKK